MMDIYAVWIKNSNFAWIDSLWINSGHDLLGADQRAESLRTVFKCFDMGYAVWVSVMRLEDARLSEATAKEASVIEKPKTHGKGMQK